MKLFDIVKYPDSRLRVKCSPVKEFNKELEHIVDTMLNTMYKARGIGLAAPQVALNKRIIVVDISEDGQSPLSLINPEIIHYSDEETLSEEGCLSIPEYRDTIKRKKNIAVKAQNIAGEEIEIKADGLLSICLQHEIDHLDGVLFIDYLSPIKKDKFKRWYKKHILNKTK